MATANVQPKADQPRVSTDNLKRAESGPSLNYRVDSIKSYDRGQKTRNYSRTNARG